MTAPHIIDPAGLLGQALGDASPDLMRHLLSTVINSLLSAEADAVCGAEYGAVSPERVNSRNGYRHRELDTRTGTIDVASRNYDPARTSPSGCSSGVNGPRPPW